MNICRMPRGYWEHGMSVSGNRSKINILFHKPRDICGGGRRRCMVMHDRDSGLRGNGGAWACVMPGPGRARQWGCGPMPVCAAGAITPPGGGVWGLRPDRGIRHPPPLEQSAIQGGGGKTGGGLSAGRRIYTTRSCRKTIAHRGISAPFGALFYCGRTGVCGKMGVYGRTDVCGGVDVCGRAGGAQRDLCGAAL